MASHRGMPTDPIDRAAAVASDYEALQGLTAVAMGIGLIMIAAPSGPTMGLVWVAMGAAIGQGYYHQKYGSVRRSADQRWGTIGAAILVVVVACAGILADRYLQLPVLLGALAIAVALLIFFRSNYRHVGVTRIHHGAAAVVALGTLLPLTGWFETGSQWQIDCVLLGLAFIVIGLVDHLRLTRAMKTMADD